MRKELFIKGQVYNLTADEVVEKFNPLCEKLSRRFFINSFTQEDLKQVCMMELFKAYKKYDISIGVDFLNYAYGVIQNELKRLLRDSKSDKRNTDDISILNIDSNVGGSSDAHTYGEVIADESVNVAEQVVTSELMKIINSVVTEEEMVLLPVLMGLKTAKAVSIEIGISNEGVRKRILRLKEKLRKCL